MKFLEQIAELERRTQELLDAATKLEQTIEEGKREAAEAVEAIRQALANAPQPFTIDIKVNGQDVTISERDGFVLVAAFVRCLDGEEVTLRLASGQSVAVKLTDVEHIAAAILAVGP